MKTLLLQFASVLLLVGAIAGCDAFGSDDDEEARLRLYNGSPDAGRVDLVVNGELKGFSIPFRHAIGYVPVPAEEDVNVTVRSEGEGGQVLAEETVSLEADQQYSLYALGPVSNLRPMLLKEAQLPEDDGALTGSSRFRVLHGSTTAGAVDVYFVRIPVGSEDFVPDLSSASPAYTGVNYGALTSETTLDVSIDPESDLGNSFSFVTVPSGSTNLEDAYVQIDRGYGVNGAYMALLVDEPDSLQQLGPNAQILSGVRVAE